MVRVTGRAMMTSTAAMNRPLGAVNESKRSRNPLRRSCTASAATLLITPPATCPSALRCSRDHAGCCCIARLFEPDRRPEHLEQMHKLVWLAHVCDPAEIHDRLNVLVEASRREQDDRARRGLCLSTELTTHREPAQSRHHHVADHRIRKPAFDHDLQRLHAILRAADVEPVTGEPQLEQTAQRVVIFCDENPRWVALRHKPLHSLERWFNCELVIRWAQVAARRATGLSQPFVNYRQGATLRGDDDHGEGSRR